MKTTATLSAMGSILIVCAAAAFADTPAPELPQAETQIPFANHGGIYDWRVVNDRTVLIESQNRKWYKATLLSSCIELPFAETIGFESNADGSFDKFSSIKVRGQDCPLVSLVETAAPPKKSAPHKSAPTAPGAPQPPVQIPG